MHYWIFISSVVVVSLIWFNGSSNGSEDLGSFWHITDPHIDQNYSCQGALGNYECDSPLTLWISALNTTRRFRQQPPDFVIFSGDSVAHDEHLPRAKFLDVMRSAAQRLRLLFPDNQIPIIPVLGNHDVHPANVLEVGDSAAAAQERLEWCGLLATDRELWADWIALGQPDPTPNAARNSSEVFTTGCFFSRRVNISEGSSLVLVSVNGMLWYSNNKKSDPSLPDPAGQFAWLETTLLRARESNTKVLLICHFPPGATENSPSKYRHFFDNYNERFLTLLRRNADILIGGLFAHQHTDTFRVLKKQDEPVLPLLFGPSISPWRLGGLGAFNPRVRVFEYSRSTLRLMDYHQLFLNLSAAEPTWTREYSFREEYRLPDASAASLSALLTDFVHSEANWTRYWSHQLGGLPHASGDCPTLGSPRRCQHLCAMFCLSYADLDRCLNGCKVDSPLVKLLPSAFPRDAGLATAAGGFGDHMTEHWSPLPITVVVIVVFLAILLGVVLLVNRELCRRRRREHAGHLGSLFNANQNGYFGCSSASETGGRDIDRFTSLSLSRPSSLDGSLEVQADDGALIRSVGDAGGRQTPLDRFSGLVKFNRTRGSCDHSYHPHEPVNSPRSKFASVTAPAYPRLAYISGDDTFRSAGASMQGGPGSRRRSPPDITDECGEEDEGVEEGDYDNEDDNLELGLDYDAEGEDEEDLFFRPPALPAPVATNGSRMSMNLKPLRGLISDLPSRLNGRCLLTTSTSIAPAQRGQSATSPPLPSTQDEVHDLSDAEYYSIHSSLQYLHPGGGVGARGSASPDSMMASTVPPSQSACGAFRCSRAAAADTAAPCDSCSTVDGATPSSGSLGGSLDSSTSAASKREPAPTGLSSTNGEIGRSHATSPSTASTSFISSAPSNIFPVVGTAPGGGVVGSAAEA